ncbi:MAG: GNAT family N-acetyltransferase [Eubacteriales bacterium]|nr:GNAT family N-acetyltransferase [Eubacteriales bacterium]
MRRYLSLNEALEIEGIVRASNDKDNTTYDIPLDADYWFLKRRGGRIIGFLAVFVMGDTYKGNPVDELLLFTDPEERGRGIGSELLSRYFKYKPVTVRFSAYGSECSEAFFKKLNAVHVYDELYMELLLGELSEASDSKEAKAHDGMPGDNGTVDRAMKKGKEGTLEKAEESNDDNVRISVTEEGDRIYENGHSELSLRLLDEETAYIYNVRTDESYLRRGSAKGLLKNALNGLRNEGAVKVLLQVSSENVPAFKLYEGLGFKTSCALSQWYLT